ncbi:hypothetical protein TRFO_25244 [Tritrichomonas foetus]|uniref:Uncharacterized protein n=1 Tax=Tritrichomonas foetus TaxID=1144522 RepID=A0A1J4KB01_9EUKA|nr:hypothetical protein TRFO_25244 [Tritrichomonas foetus]|eukprot:OHT06637.1 hypothetical protein TRFO_25244 [Tritrichomonas foetus]
MDEKAAYNFYRSYVPTNMSDLIKKSNTSIENQRQEIIVRQRLINNFELQYTNYPEFAPTKQELTNFVFNQKILNPDEIASDIVQNSSLLIPQIYSDLDSFSNAVLKAPRTSLTKKEFQYIVNAVIPMVFGYFSSEEYVEIAAMFYTHIIGKTKPKKACKIVTPFFRGLPTFRYIEHVMTRFVIKFGSEINLNEIAISKLTYENISNQFFEFLNSALSLIPSTHILLINIMKDIGWTIGMVSYFFFQQFFIFGAERWIESSPYTNHKDMFVKILKNILEPAKMNNTISLLLQTSSKYEVPYLYQPFSHKYLNLLVSSHEIKYVTKLLKSVDRLTFDYKYTVPDDILYSPYWVRVYPSFERFDMTFGNVIFNNFTPYFHKHPKSTTRSSSSSSSSEHHASSENQASSENPYTSELSPEDSLVNSHNDEISLTQKAPFKIDFEKERIFGLIESNITIQGDTVIDMLQSDKYKNVVDDDFYNYAQHKSLEKLKSIAKRFELFLYQQIFVNVLTDFNDLSANHYNMTFGLVANCQTFEFLTPKLTQTSYLVQIQPYLVELFKQYSNKFMELSNLWSKYSEAKKGTPITTAYHGLSKRRKCIFWESVEQLRNLTTIPYFLRFDLLNESLRKIEMISTKRMEYLMNALIVTENYRILTTFSLFSTCLMKSDSFRTIVSDEFINLWTSFESTFLQTLTHSEDFGLANLFIQLQTILDEEMKKIEQYENNFYKNESLT